MQERVKPAGKPKTGAGSGTKKVTFAIDARLAADAAAKGIDLAAVLEQALRLRLQAVNASGLTQGERESLEWAERYVAENGPWWDHSESE